MTISIRPLANNNLETANTILKLAFRSSVSRIQDLRLYRQIQPDGLYLAFQNENPIGMVGAIIYPAFAYVGFMAVHPDAQRLGTGQALMEFVLDRLDRQNIPQVLLDASAMGQPLYEKLGFIADDETLTFQRDNTFTAPDCLSRIQPITAPDLDELIAWDANIFGTGRGKVLQIFVDVFPERAYMLRDEMGQIAGYFFAQKRRIGPWVMHQDAHAAEALLRTALALPYEETVSVIVPAVNLDAIDLLLRYGFKQIRVNRHMVRGLGESPGQRHKIYAQTSLSIG